MKVKKKDTFTDFGTTRLGVSWSVGVSARAGVVSCAKATDTGSVSLGVGVGVVSCAGSTDAGSVGVVCLAGATVTGSVSVVRR